MKSLIIVESFTKTKTIKKYINDDNYIVTFTSGHIYNLPKDKLGFDTESWKIDYIETNGKIIKNIRDLVKKSDIIYLAADPDMEGEAIANNVKMCIKDLVKNKTCHRITFNEITKDAVKNAIENPRDINKDVVNAQETRRIVDRLIGYKVSPVLWSKFNMNYLSAGRVQFAALLICINQKNLIQTKEIKKYWKIEGKFIFNKTNKKNNIVGTLLDDNSNEFKINDINLVKDIITKMSINEKYEVSYNIIKRKVYPQPPYTTTALQQDSYNKFKFNAKNTMKLAQDLYENGLITYLRTDSTSISEDAKKKFISYIKDVYSENYAKYRTYKTKISNAQEAHEAIRITNPKIESCTFEGCTLNHNKLYDIIRKRSLACLMEDAEYSDIVIIFNNNKYIFKSTKSFMTFDGFYKIYDNKIESYDEFLKTIKDSYLYEINANGKVDDIPSMYNEVQLIKQLEKLGIGRPSTYSTIIDKLLEKKYVEIGQNPQQEYNVENLQKKSKDFTIKNVTMNLGGKQKDLLLPTELGSNVIEYIYNIMPYLCDLKFTANMENDLDDIINAKNKKEIILNVLYEKIKESLKDINIKKPVKEEYKTGIVNTKYGYCYYNKEKNKYTNIDSYLKWKNINASQLKTEEIKFLAALPKKVSYNNGEYYLNIGRYGLYLKDDNNKNYKLEKKLWDKYVT